MSMQFENQKDNSVIIGIDVRKQCAAASCCCNLALGDSRACMAVTKAAGPYLTAALDNLSTELAVRLKRIRFCHVNSIRSQS